jgi:hypothetical protein
MKCFEREVIFLLFFSEGFFLRRETRWHSLFYAAAAAEESVPALKQGLVRNVLKVNRNKAARSSEWVKVTERPREASCGVELTVRVARQRRNTGPGDVTKRKVVRQ